MRTEIIGRRFLRNVLLITTLLLFLVRIGAQGRGMVIKTAEGKEVGSFESSYALVIGESDYTEGWPDLPGVKTDVEQVSNALRESGFQVITKTDLSFDNLKAVYEDFIDLVGLDEDTRLIFYYAGHGHTLKLADGRDMGYIVPVDAPNPNRDEAGFKKRAITMEQFDAWARRIESRHVLFLFDSCFSGIDIQCDEGCAGEYHGQDDEGGAAVHHLGNGD